MRYCRTTLLATLAVAALVAPAAFGTAAYVRNSYPWGQTYDRDNLQWYSGTVTEYYMDDIDTPAELCTLLSNHNQIFLEGSDGNGQALQNFLARTASGQTYKYWIEQWVAAGHGLIINAAPNSGGSYYLPGDAYLNYPANSSSASLYNYCSPWNCYYSITQTFTGNSFAHAILSGNYGCVWYYGNAGGAVLSAQSYGSGRIVYGCMTTPNYHNDPTSSNYLRRNAVCWTWIGSNGPCPFTVCNDAAPDNCGNALNLSSYGASGSWSQNTCGFCSDYTTCYGHTNGPDVFFYYPVPNNYQIVLAQQGYYYDGVTILRWGGSCPGTTQLYCEDGEPYTYTWVNTTGSTQYVYYIRDGWGSACGQFNFTWNVTSTCTAPAITSQPSGATKEPGESHTFSVTASGSPAPTYQWQKFVSGSWTNISGATSSSYTINPIYPGDEGDYRCVATNDCGSATSDTATLTVEDCTNPTLTLHPSDTCLSAGEQLVIHVQLSGPQSTCPKIVGGQFLLDFDASKLSFVSATTAAPWAREISEIVGSGTLDYAVGSDPNEGAVSGTMATLTFDVIDSACSITGVVSWRSGGSPPTRLTDEDDGVYDVGSSNLTTIDTELVSLDLVGPTLTPGSINPCYDTQAQAEAAALAATTASDNCDQNVDLSVSSTLNGCTADITVTGTDDCGNTGTVGYTATIDPDPPVLTAGSIGGCYTSVALAEAAAIAATTATDNCDASVDLTASTSLNGCDATITVTGTDDCGKSASITYTTVVDDQDPVLTAGSIGICYTSVAAAEADALAATTATDNCDLSVALSASTSLNGCEATITVTGADECGNDASVTYTTVVDDQVPTLTAGSIDTCYDTLAEAEAAALAATAASDNCDANVDLTVTSTLNGCVATITVTGTDDCGNSSSVIYTATIDPDAPSVTAGSIGGCYTTVAAAEADALAATTVSDGCDPNPSVAVSTSLIDCDATITVTATDACGNSASVQYATKIDADPPTVTAGMIDACYPDEASAEAAALAATTASDTCTNVTLSASTSGTCTAEITVTATDECGNSASVLYATRIDDTDPVVTCPADLDLIADLSGCNDTDPGSATVSDNCDPNVVGSYVRSDGKTLDEPFCVLDSPITITWTAVDSCGNTGTCVQTVTVALPGDFVINVEYEGAFSGTWDRCIRFQIYNGGALQHTVDQLITFTNGAGSTSFSVTPGWYDCITAQDLLHTLSRTRALVGGNYAVDFTIASGDPLVPGNLNNDTYVDIIDFGLWVNRYAQAFAVNTTCATPLYHPDIDGSGFADESDYSFIQSNFWENGEGLCGPEGDGSNGGPIERISLADLRAMGLGELTILDLNGDGWYDTTDVQLWLEGVRPYQKADEQNLGDDSETAVMADF